MTEPMNPEGGQSVAMSDGRLEYYHDLIAGLRAEVERLKERLKAHEGAMRDALEAVTPIDQLGSAARVGKILRAKLEEK